MKTALGLAHIIVIAGMVFALLILSACQPSTLVSALEGVIAAAEIAVPVIGSAVGLPPQTQAAIVAYLQLVDAAAVKASTILAGTGTSAEKSTRIIAAFANITEGCNCIPAGTPQTVVNMVNVVAQAVGKFIGNFQHQGILPTKPVVVKVGGQDRAALAKIRHRAEVHMLKLQELKK